MLRWSHPALARWALKGQLLAAGLLGLVVLMPFVMLPAIVALLVTAVILGPRNLLWLAFPRRRGQRAQARP